MDFTLINFLALHYVRLFLKRPVLTGVLTVIVIGIGAFGIYSIESQHRAEEQKRRESLANYAQQLTQLDTVQQSLKNLFEFVVQQRTRLQESEQVISQLKEEKQRIEPLVQADRSVVEAVFQLQEQRASSSISRERWIGFGFGILASLLASFIFAAMTIAWRRTKKSNETGNA